MKKLIGIGITVACAVATMVLWSFVGMTFELEGVTRDRIGQGVNLAALTPTGVYLCTIVCTHLRYKKRLDANHYQPLYRHPMGLIMNVILQMLLLVLAGFPSQSAGQTSSAFITAVVLVLAIGTASLTAALIFGRPIGGRTSFPFAKHTQYQ